MILFINASWNFPECIGVCSIIGLSRGMGESRRCRLSLRCPQSYGNSLSALQHSVQPTVLGGPVQNRFSISRSNRMIGGKPDKNVRPVPKTVQNWSSTCLLLRAAPKLTAYACLFCCKNCTLLFNLLRPAYSQLSVQLARELTATKLTADLGRSDF